MKLVEADLPGPSVVEDAPAIPTPPRPEHRRVAVSLLFTIAVLVGTVVAIYWRFPARHGVLMTEAVSAHRTPPAWQLEHPTVGELRAWSVAVVGPGAPLPTSAGLDVVGARELELFRRSAALVRYRVGGAEVTLLVQQARDVAAHRISQRDGDDQIEAWRAGAWSCVAVGGFASADRWRPALGVP